MSLAAVLLALPAATSAGAAGGAADAPRPDKSVYTLFNPTPREYLRDLSPDRPDQTESPHSVDAGHFQIESDMVALTLDHDRSGGGDMTLESFAFASINFKVGLLNNVDFQVVIDPLVALREEDRTTGKVRRSSGLGDLQTRLKLNLWGNDEGSTAGAIMGFVKWPLPESALRNGRTEGGLIMPVGFSLPRGWDMTLMTEVDFVRNAEDDGHAADFVNSITFGRDIVGPVSGYVEFFTVVRTSDDSEWSGQFDIGFKYAISADTEFDLGCNFGVTDSAPDWNPFLGVTWRF